MTQIGKHNKLKVVKTVDFGLYLDGKELGEILLPTRYVPDGCKPGDIIEVFIYNDSEDRIIATTEQPLAEVDDFAFLKVAAVNPVGVFLEWGLSKDLLVPFREQSIDMKEGRSYIVRVYLDNKSNRIAASAKLDKFLNDLPPEYDPYEEVDLFICNDTDIGYKAIINNSHWGMLYKNEVFQTLKQGQKIKGFIEKIRDDGKIDLCLQKPGYSQIEEVSAMILDSIKNSGGFIGLTDKSDPEAIYKMFGISKKTYKKALGALYREELILLEKEGIRIKDKDSQ
ncbi:MAG: S1-like domain-containing RNA-binding protein [Elusimicrobiota bacterium]